MSANDGGPAFPQHGWTSNPEVLARMNEQFGMTLRDWFAGQALVALPHIGCGCDLNTEEAALAAYQFADAMLKARGQ